MNLTQEAADKLAQEIVEKANNGYHHDNERYPRFAIDSMTDRNRWTAYLSLVIGESTSPDVAELVIRRAHDGYHRDAERYPPFAIAPWDDRPRWTAYMKTIMSEVFAEEITS